MCVLSPFYNRRWKCVLFSHIESIKSSRTIHSHCSVCFIHATQPVMTNSPPKINLSSLYYVPSILFISLFHIRTHSSSLCVHYTEVFSYRKDRKKCSLFKVGRCSSCGGLFTAKIDRWD
jgi:hypothetical protein